MILYTERISSRMGGRLGMIGGMLGAALLAAAGAVAAYQELNPFAAGEATAAGRFAALAADAYSPAPSLLSKRLLLDACFEAIAGLYGRLQPAEQRREVVVRCRRHADAVAGEAPSYAFGWFVGALAAAELGDTAGFNARLRNAQVTGPAEQWVAELRVELAEDRYPLLAPDVSRLHEADLRLLVASRRGIRAIADRYVRSVDFRARIAAIVESMPEADQARFVTVLRDVVADAATP